MTYRLQSILVFGIAALAFATSATAQDSTAKSEKKKAGTAFFDNTTPLDMTITVNLKQLQRDKGDSVPWRNATLAFTDTDGKAKTIPMKMRTRGIWRLKKCEYPPIRLNFAKPAVKGTMLEGLDKPKLVSFCRDAQLHEQYILQEYQLYRINNLITPHSHKVRLVRLSYADSATGKVEAKRYAIIEEEPEALAARLGGKMIKDKGALADDLDDYATALFGLFQYAIGNTDFSITAMHNAELLTLTTGSLIPVAYDFDFAGAVNTTYATPEPRLRLENVRIRRYRGYCVPTPQFDSAVAVFNAKKPEILALYDDPIGKLMIARLNQSTVDYLNEFYKIINDRGTFRSQVIESCLPRNQSDAPNR